MLLRSRRHIIASTLSVLLVLRDFGSFWLVWVTASLGASGPLMFWKAT